MPRGLYVHILGTALTFLSRKASLTLYLVGLSPFNLPASYGSGSHILWEFVLHHRYHPTNTVDPQP